MRSAGGGPWDVAKRLFSRAKEESVPERRADPPRRAPERQSPVDDDHDRLTGLLNVQAITRQLEQAVSAALTEGEAVAYACIAVDNFDMLVEEHGRMRLDQCLREVASRVRECVRADDHCGRLDGPHFAVVFRGLAARLQSHALVARLRVRLAEPILINGQPFQLAASAGVANFGLDGRTLDTLRTAAAEALKKSREQARLSAIAAADAARVKAEADAAAGAAAAAAEKAAAES